MIESIITTPVTLASNSSAVSYPTDDVRTCSAKGCNAFVFHTEGNPIYKLAKGGRYQVDIDATLTSLTAAGVVALGVYEDGVLLPDTVSAETIAAAGDLANVSAHKKVTICPNDDTVITIASVPSVVSGATLTATDTQVPTIIASTLSITRLNG